MKIIQSEKICGIKRKIVRSETDRKIICHELIIKIIAVNKVKFTQ